MAGALLRRLLLDRFSEQSDWESPITSRIPIFSAAGGQLSCRYNRNWITGATVRMNRPLSAEETAMFDFFDDAARANALSLRLDPGDMYFASNYTVLHGKAAHEDEPDLEDVKRLLLRVWINIPGFRQFADEATVRYGLTSHGNIGWTGRSSWRAATSRPAIAGRSAGPTPGCRLIPRAAPHQRRPAACRPAAPQPGPSQPGPRRKPPWRS
jgi:hypothetical protein